MQVSKGEINMKRLLSVLAAVLLLTFLSVSGALATETQPTPPVFNEGATSESSIHIPLPYVYGKSFTVGENWSVIPNGNTIQGYYWRFNNGIAG